MFPSIRARLIALFAALVLAPIVALSAVSIAASRNLADTSVSEYEKSLLGRSEAEIAASLRELSRLQDRTFGGIERRAQAMAAQANQVFQVREGHEHPNPWTPEVLADGFHGWMNSPDRRASVWIPKSDNFEGIRRDLGVLSRVEPILAAEPRGEGMTQWYIIQPSGISLLVPPSVEAPTADDFEPRSGIFYEPATPASNPTGRVVWTEVYNDPAGKGVMISCLAPIGSADTFMGVIGIDVNTDAFRSEIAAAGDQWEYAFLLDGRGSALLVTPEGYRDFGVSAPGNDAEKALDWKLDRIADPELRRACLAMTAASAPLSRVTIGGRERLVTHRRLESTGWILGVVADPDRFLKPARAMRATQEALHARYMRFLLFLITALLGSCVLFGWYLTRTVTRPLLRLSEAARAIGAGDPETVIGPGGPDEIGTLSDTLRQMVHNREEAQKAIAETQKLAALGGMASGICHELNNLLAPILGFAQVLGRSPLTPEQRAQVDRVERAARAAREVVGSLLDSTHELAGARQPTDLNAVAREALSQLEPARAAAGVTVAWNLAPSVPSVLANASLMQRAFFNIADNAFQAMSGAGAGKRLTIGSRIVPAGTPAPRAGSDPPRTLAHAGPHLEFTFEDEGPGIPPDHLKRIFDPFFTTKPPGSGTGLGLSVATSCVRAHGGSIRAENSPGGGARFTILVPLVQAGRTQVRGPLTPLPRAVAPPASRPRILIVDDEDSIRVLVTHALREDHDVTACEGGREAIQTLESREFDAVLCDLRLRDLPGREVYAWLRTHRPAMARRFMVITGDTHGDEGRTFLEEFRTPCVTKPFDLDDLRQRVKDLVGKRV